MTELITRVFTAANSFSKGSVWRVTVTDEQASIKVIFVDYDTCTFIDRRYLILLLSPWDCSLDITALITIFTNMCRLEPLETDKKAATYLITLLLSLASLLLIY